MRGGVAGIQRFSGAIVVVKLSGTMSEGKF